MHIQLAQLWYHRVPDAGARLFCRLFKLNLIEESALKCLVHVLLQVGGGNHGSYFYDEESSAIKALMFRFAKLAATSIEHVAQWLVWLAKELGQLTNMELHRADTEVRDIVDGKYDWRIERYENRNGLSV